MRESSRKVITFLDLLANCGRNPICFTGEFRFEFSYSLLTGRTILGVNYTVKSLTDFTTRSEPFSLFDDDTRSYFNFFDRESKRLYNFLGPQFHLRSLCRENQFC